MFVVVALRRDLFIVSPSVVCCVVSYVVNNYRQLFDNYCDVLYRSKIANNYPKIIAMEWSLSQSVPTILFNSEDQTQNCVVLLT